MASTYTTNQGIEKPAAGDQSGTWGGTVNTNMDIIDRAICGVASLTLTGSTTTLTTTDGTLTDGMYRVLILGDGGDLGSDNTITISPNDQSKCYLVYNNLTANRNAIFTQGSGANATVENGETAWIYADGAGGGAAVRTALSSTKLLDQDGDTGIRVEEGGDDDDTIRFDIAGAEDFTMTANTLTALSGSTIKTNTIAETTGASGVTVDGMIIKDGGLTIASGKTLAVASGATIANSGTATGFGGGSWTFISEANLSGGAAAGIDFTSGVSATYDCYMLHMLDVVPTDDVNMIQVRVYTGSSTLEDDAGDYVWVTGTTNIWNTGSGTRTFYRDHSAAELMLNNAQNFGNAAGENTSCLFYAYNVNSSGKTYFTWDIVHIDEGGNTVVGGGGGATTFTTVVTGFRVFSRDSNTESGTVRMYGLNKS